MNYQRQTAVLNGEAQVTFRLLWLTPLQPQTDVLVVHFDSLKNEHVDNVSHTCLCCDESGIHLFVGLF